ncbi:MAG: nucleoside deaminase [Candidatus Omnitrophota bacterium]
MKLAIKEAQKNFKGLEGGPFGACIVKGSKIISLARNTVLKSDATSHAEINAIRAASKKLKSFDLSGCVIYSTTEPCPMCFSAIHWARINTIVYGACIKDAKMIGFNELNISNYRLKNLGKSKIQIFSGFLRDECLRLFNEWNKLKNKVLY